MYFIPKMLKVKASCAAQVVSGKRTPQYAYCLSRSTVTTKWYYPPLPLPFCLSEAPIKRPQFSHHSFQHYYLKVKAGYFIYILDGEMLAIANIVCYKQFIAAESIESV